MKNKIQELIDRVKFIFELRAYDKEKRNEYLTLEKAIKTQQEIDRILNTEYAYDLTNNKEEE
jgi:hypothetical protein